MTQSLEQIELLLDQCTSEQRKQIFDQLRHEFPIHPLEERLNAAAEIILEAIDRASDLSLRGVRGLIAEAAFEMYVLTKTMGWTKERLEGNPPYDYLIKDNAGSIRIQIKMQRQVKHQPMLAKSAWQRNGEITYVVETQKTRTGTKRRGKGTETITEEKTRPYLYGEFDILAVSMHPSTGDWAKFMYTVAGWLVPKPEEPQKLNTFQPVTNVPNDVWTDDIDTCIQWFRAKEQKSVLGEGVKP